MDLFYALTVYHLLCVIAFQMQRHLDADLWLSDLMRDATILRERVEKTGLFRQVFILSDSKVKSRAARINGQHVQIDAIKKKLAFEFEDLGQIDVSQYRDLYICADHFPLGMYLNIKEIPYRYFEDGNGQQSRVEETVEDMKKDYADYYLIREMQLYGRNSNVQKRYINTKAQKEDYQFSEVDEDFCIADIFASLSDAQKNVFYEIFQVQPLCLRHPAWEYTLLFPQQNVNLGTFQMAQQLEQSAIMLDYFSVGSRFAVKPHPSDIFTDYMKLGDETELIQSNMPSELLLLACQDKFARAVSPWSTSVNSLKAIFEDIVVFDSDADRDYMKLHRYYAALYMLRAIYEDIADKKIGLLGVNAPLFLGLLQKCAEYSNTLFECKKLTSVPASWNGILVVDDVAEWEAAELDRLAQLFPQCEYVIFANSLEDYIFLRGKPLEICNNMVRWVLAKVPLAENEPPLVQNLADEDVWIYGKEWDALEKLENVSYEKRLRCCNLLVKANLQQEGSHAENRQELYYQFRMLEGILRATEERVRIEAERNRELEQQIRDLK